MNKKTALAISNLRHNRRLRLAGDAAMVAGLTYIATLL
jgi:uncharacterized protein YjeT (DUF2065 family)